MLLTDLLALSGGSKIDICARDLTASECGAQTEISSLYPVEKPEEMAGRNTNVKQLSLLPTSTTSAWTF